MSSVWYSINKPSRSLLLWFIAAYSSLDGRYSCRYIGHGNYQCVNCRCGSSLWRRLLMPVLRPLLMKMCMPIH